MSFRTIENTNSISNINNSHNKSYICESFIPSNDHHYNKSADESNDKKTQNKFLEDYYSELATEVSSSENSNLNSYKNISNTYLRDKNYQNIANFNTQANYSKTLINETYESGFMRL